MNKNTSKIHKNDFYLVKQNIQNQWDKQIMVYFHVK